MLTTAASILVAIVKYYAIFESSVAFFIILEGILNIHLGIRSTYIKCLLKVFKFGNNRVEVKRPVIELTQKPERVWNAMAAEEKVLEDDEVYHKPLEVELKYKTTPPSDFKLQNVLPLIQTAMKDIVEDEVTKAFDAEGLPYWNMLTRTNKGYQYISFRLSVIWFAGWWFRHFILFPVRFMIAIAGQILLVLSAMLCSRLPAGKVKTAISRYATKVTFRILARALSLHATYHDRKNMAKRDGICVANHTSPIDVIVLSCDNVYAFVGQQGSGLFGFIQKEIAKAFSHIWFERAESKDRGAVVARMKDHVKDPNKPTILIFPEGACVNNTSVLMFKKGGFELDSPVYPVAIRYNPVFGDAFWGAQPTMQAHIWSMLTSWAIVCDVWYLPVMNKLPGEDAASFANRTRLEIAKRGGMVDIDWDPRFYSDDKNVEVSRWRLKQQQILSETMVQRKTNATPETFPETDTLVKNAPPDPDVRNTPIGRV
ncbi:Glycerol-3-phosphate acyltransferase 4 [Hypsibius exemplaris]|uniref:Glycerol-3-phosphate acyltransferase 4 n=1 Tax=Hypsibius exemplaris TaxID=2072580 RepID=A0A1W0XD13_HYPEX|nr:Glycerol-3-phosphate acyltransferase 4 [Hypsibius exemplaris]